MRAGTHSARMPKDERVKILVFNPGSNALKAGVVCCHPSQQTAADGHKLIEVICESLSWCGLKLDAEKNQSVIDREGRLSTEDSRIEAYAIPVEESLQIAHECCRVMEKNKAAA
jgi:acetate kinase